jgi:hypothetical protein
VSSITSAHSETQAPEGQLHLVVDDEQFGRVQSVLFHERDELLRRSDSCMSTACREAHSNPRAGPGLVAIRHKGKLADTAYIREFVQTKNRYCAASLHNADRDCRDR